MKTTWNKVKHRIKHLLLVSDDRKIDRENRNTKLFLTIIILFIGISLLVWMIEGLEISPLDLSPPPLKGA